MAGLWGAWHNRADCAAPQLLRRGLVRVRVQAVVERAACCAAPGAAAAPAAFHHRRLALPALHCKSQASLVLLQSHACIASTRSYQRSDEAWPAPRSSLQVTVSPPSVLWRSAGLPRRLPGQQQVVQPRAAAIRARRAPQSGRQEVTEPPFLPAGGAEGRSGRGGGARCTRRYTRRCTSPRARLAPAPRQQRLGSCGSASGATRCGSCLTSRPPVAAAGAGAWRSVRDAEAHDHPLHELGRQGRP